jgi:hypothetical protein
MIALLIILAILFLVQRYLNNNFSYQKSKLEKGTIDQKIKAISFMSDRKNIDIIPILMENIDNQDRGHWDKDPKGGLITLSCVSTSELENLTGQKLGSTCYWNTKNETDENSIVQKWRDWYNNQYSKWLDGQTKK